MRKSELFQQLYEANIKQTEAIEELSKFENMLDSQSYLNWKDKLNELSLDPDRE